jgi:hypothetical protein
MGSHGVYKRQWRVIACRMCFCGILLDGQNVVWKQITVVFCDVRAVGMAPRSFIGRMKVKVWVKARGEVVSKRVVRS